MLKKTQKPDFFEEKNFFTHSFENNVEWWIGC